MCRFIAYLGKKPIIINQILGKTDNSLINQSRQAQESRHKVNADGVGMGWYNHAINEKPALFKSIQPAWNDHNLNYIASKIQSTCFIGHIRASTVGDVSFFNCHPFAFKQFLFAHNGTIINFGSIKRHILGLLSDELFSSIKGQTDSECFFALLMNTLHQKHHSHVTLDDFATAMQEAINSLHKVQTQHLHPHLSYLNIVLTDGHQLIATRYAADNKKTPLSLYYTVGDYVKEKRGHGMMHSSAPPQGAILVASEPLTDYASEWQEVPSNHMLLINKNFKITLRAIT